MRYVGDGVAGGGGGWSPLGNSSTYRARGLLPDNPQDYVLVRIISVIYLSSGKFFIKLCS